jgi:DNA-binding protein HU-beta
MTKAELVARIAEETKITQGQAATALTSLIKAVTDEVLGSGSITVAGLGTFSLVKRAERSGFNPRTKEPLRIPASQSVKFKVAKALKDAVNE